MHADGAVRLEREHNGTGRSLLQAKKGNAFLAPVLDQRHSNFLFSFADCPVDFKGANYTAVTSRCKDLVYQPATCSRNSPAPTPATSTTPAPTAPAPCSATPPSTASTRRGSFAAPALRATTVVGSNAPTTSSSLVVRRTCSARRRRQASPHRLWRCRSSPPYCLHRIGRELDGPCNARIGSGEENGKVRELCAGFAGLWLFFLLPWQHRRTPRIPNIQLSFASVRAGTRT
jgi:hypothetical protein